MTDKTLNVRRQEVAARLRQPHYGFSEFNVSPAAAAGELVRSAAWCCMELVSGPLARAVYLAAIGQIVEFLRLNGIGEILVAYGWGCDCPDNQLYQDVSMPLERLQPFIAESEAADYYRVAKDNLHVKDPAGRCEFLWCHESDIHLITDEEGLLKQLEAIWLANEYKDVYEKRGADWQKVVPVTG